MTFIRRLHPSALLALTLGAGACRSFDVEQNQFAIISVPTTPASGGGFITSPSAIFFEGTGVQLSTTQVGIEGCVDRLLGTPAPPAFEDIDAGPAVEVSLSGIDATLLPVPSITGVKYQLPNGVSFPSTPGNQITLTIPGAVGGFPARVVRARTVEAFTPSAIALPAATTDELPFTWTPLPSLPGSAMFYSFRYAATGTANFDREIACVFADDGSGSVAANLLNGFRTSGFRAVFAQRALVTLERFGSAVTHVTSTLSVTVPVAGDQ